MNSQRERCSLEPTNAPTMVTVASSGHASGVIPALELTALANVDLRAAHAWIGPVRDDGGGAVVRRAVRDGRAGGMEVSVTVAFSSDFGIVAGVRTATAGSIHLRGQRVRALERSSSAVLSLPHAPSSATAAAAIAIRAARADEILIPSCALVDPQNGRRHLRARTPYLTRRLARRERATRAGSSCPR